MAIVWGPWATGSNDFRVGIDLSLSGTVITARYYVESQYNANDNQVLNRSGALTGSTSYTKSGSGVQGPLYSGTAAGSRGSTYTFGASISGIYTGATPSVSVSITIPAAVPGTPAAPTISNVTSTSLKGNLASAPASNGASITNYQWETDTGSKTGTTGTTRSWSLGGLVPNTNYRARVRALNSAGWGGWSNWSSMIKTAPSSPTAQGKPVVTRNSDTSHTVAWAHNGSSAAPYASQVLERRVGLPSATGTQWGAYAGIANLSATATSYTDTTTVGGREYQYRAVAKNVSGSATSTASEYIRTTPGAPTGLVATKSGTSISVEGTHLRCSTQTYEWQDSPGGAAYVTAGSVTNAVEQTFASVNAAVTHAYRVRSRVPASSAAGAPLLYSAWSSPSNTVQLQAPPSAPVTTTPTGTLDRDLPIPFGWKHVPVDSTKQAAAELRYKINAGAWTTVTATTLQALTVAALGVSGQVEWQVRTRGDHPTFGDWSPIATFTLAARPTVALSSPTDGWPTGRAKAKWGYYAADGSPQAQWQGELLDADGVRKGPLASGSGATATVTFAAATQVLTTATTYTVRVRVRSGSGLWSEWDEATFTTDFPLPWEATVDALWERTDGSTGLAFLLDDTAAGHVEAVTLDVQRQIDNGEWETIVTGLDPHSTWADRTHTIAGDILWRAVTYSADGALTIGPVTEMRFRPVDQPPADGGDAVWVVDGYLSAGDGWGDTVRAMLFLDVNEPEFGLDDITLHRFAGDQWPTEFAGIGMKQILDVSFITPPATQAADVDGVALSTLADVRRVIATRGPKLWRDPDGHAFPVSVSPISAERVAPGFHKVSLKLERVGDREGV